MTTEEILEYYVGLLIIQYAKKPKAQATIAATVGPMVMDQLPLQVQDAFDLNTAVGKQLDVLGKYAGIARAARTFTGLVSLNDTDYRMIVKMKIGKNHSYAILSDIQQLLFLFFPGSVLVFDYTGMRMSYYIDSNLVSLTVAEILIRNELLPRPMGVGLGATVYAPNITGFFAMRTYDIPATPNTGFNTYANYQAGTHWLSYADALTM